jgi:thiol-disulfide isomerase/thioredoxin
VPCAGSVTIIELWAQWCGPCRQVFPHLSRIYSQRKDKGLVVVGISVDDDPGLAAFFEQQGDKMAYTVAVDKVHHCLKSPS